MSKRDQKFARIDSVKERIRKMSSEKIYKILNSGYMKNEGQIAYREILQERGEWDEKNLIQQDLNEI